MRKAGVLLAVSSLPSKYGIGDFGEEAEEFLKWLKKCGFKLWQILPLNPVGFGHSPYQPYSSYAIDEIYISLELLKDSGKIKKIRSFAQTGARVDYEAVRSWKEQYLKEAFKSFKPNKAYRDFLENKWLETYVDFRALKKMNQNEPWNSWKKKTKEALSEEERAAFEQEKEYQLFLQFTAFEQWKRLKQKAARMEIEIMGDMPFYVGLDSADVWGSQKSFLLDKDGHPQFIAGVPPDYFSETGQRWGNPIYNWEQLEQDGFDFWIQRLSWAKQMTDIVRIDHFRAFDTYWKIPASCPTAIEGQWMEAPGYAFFDTLLRKIPDISIAAEDLGMLRPEVYQLRDHYHFRGMKIIQFTYDRQHGTDTMEDRANLIAYSGTHDNETLRSWLSAFSVKEKRLAKEFLKRRECDDHSLVLGFIEYLLKSRAELVILPVQDLLQLDNRSRMNVPGTVDGNNWSWRLKDLKRLQEIRPELRLLLRKSFRI